MRLGVGDTVVYGTHGAGAITSLEVKEVRGEQQTVLMLAFPHGLSIELPLARAEEQLRPLADADEIGRLGVVLRSDSPVDAGPWLKRQHAARAKMGTAVGLAEIVGEAARRATLAPTERDLVRRAKDLLAGEIALARGEDTTTASAWIDEQIACR